MAGWAKANDRPVGRPISKEEIQKRELRDYFAARAMQGIVGSIDSEENYVRLADLAKVDCLETVSAWIAREAYKQADAMLREREKGGA